MDATNEIKDVDAPGCRGDVFDWRGFDPSTLPAGEGSAFARELVAFRDHLDEMLAAHRGEFVTIKGDRVVAYHPDPFQALDAAFQTFGHEPVLIKQVLDREPVAHLGR